MGGALPFHGGFAPRSQRFSVDSSNRFGRSVSMGGMNHQEVHHHDIVGETTLALSTSTVVVFAGTGPIANLAAHGESQTARPSHARRDRSPPGRTELLQA